VTISTWEYLLTMPARPSAVGVARAAVRAALHEPALTGVLDDAALITSELVSNALVHGDGEVRLRLSWSGEALTIEVDDKDPTLPQWRRSAPDEVSGRGLYLVDALAQAWGCTLLGGSGKVVWGRLMGELV
jgi:anti-sigma regulatory factor (Ser/Thr protein kinase)